MATDPTLEIARLGEAADGFFEEVALPTIAEYVTIRCVSPEYDAAWAERGEIARAAALLAGWAASRPVPGAGVEVLEREGLTPAIVIDVPATDPAVAGVTLIYGHLDKQPPLGTWRDGLDPYLAVRDGDALYGRGTADDGYSIFAAVGALELLAAGGRGHGRVVVLIEASEESGSPHLAGYLDDAAALIGGDGPALVICLDSGCVTYDRLWTTSSLRGNVVCTLEVDVLTAGVHSGSAGGVVPSSFRLVRLLCSRIEDPATGEILVAECRAPIADRHRMAAEALVAEVGDAAAGDFPTVAGLRLAGDSPVDRVLAQTFGPSLSTVGIDGVPAVADGGNVLRPFTTVKLSLRLPPGADHVRAAEALVRVLEADPPEGAKVAVEVLNAAPGFEAPAFADWLQRAVRERLRGAVRPAARCRRRGRHHPVPADARRPVPRRPVPRDRRARPRVERARAGRDAAPPHREAHHRRGGPHAHLRAVTPAGGGRRRRRGSTRPPLSRRRRAAGAPFGPGWPRRSASW